MINFDDYVSENRTELNGNWPYTLDHPYTILIIGGSGSGKRNVLLNLINNQPDIDKIYLYAKDWYDAKYQYLINIREKVWPYTLDHPYTILIIGGSGSGKRNVLLNLINNQPDIDKIYLYAKDWYDAKYQYLINIREKVGIDHLDDPKAFIEYSNDMRDVYKNINEDHPDKENKILIVFDGMVADMTNNKTLDSIVTELFIRERKLSISLVFIAQSYFKIPKDARLNTTHFFIAKILSKRELQQIAINH